MLFQGEHDRGNIVGLNQNTGEPIDPQMEGIFDNYAVKRQIINSGYGWSWLFDTINLLPLPNLHLPIFFILSFGFGTSIMKMLPYHY